MDPALIYTFSLSFFVSGMSIFLLWPAAREYGLVDKPDMRKQHNGHVPLIGGVCVFLGVWATILIPGIDNPSNFFIYLIILLVTGLADDYLGLSISVRIVIQCLVAFAVCLADDHLITYTGDLLGLGDLGTGFLAVPITVIAIVTAINAFNMIDGVDGLASSLAIVSFSSLAAIFGLKGLWEQVIICLAFTGALIPFLLSNFPLRPYRVKVFLGDAGSIIIGFSIVWLLIEGSQPWDRAHPESRAFLPVTAMWIVGLPLFDLMSVSIRRILRGRSPMSGDRSHIHHIILDRGFNTIQCLAFCVGIELAMSAIGIFFDAMELESVSFYLFWLAFAIYHFFTTRASYREA